MVSGTRQDTESGQFISIRVRKTIQSIREVVGNHSDADIYAVLKEANMDPNETAQKLLNQDPFHEVKRKRNKKKELTGYKIVDSMTERTPQWAKSSNLMVINGRRGGSGRTPIPDVKINKEFRIVRDNRLNKNFSMDTKSMSWQPSPGNEQNKSNISKQSILDVDEESESLDASGRRDLLLEKMKTISLSTNSEPAIDVYESSLLNALVSTSYVDGIYSSYSDPVHVPSPSSRTVGAIRCQVGAVGVRKQSFSVPGTLKIPNNLDSVSFAGKVNSSAANLCGDSNITYASQLGQVPASQPSMLIESNGRAASVQYHINEHLHTVNHNRAMQPNMEWKPKSLKPKTDGSSVIGTSTPQSLNDNVYSTNSVDAIDLSDKFSHVQVFRDEHVIIPQHLRVPEFVCTQLTFGSFKAGFISRGGIMRAHQLIEIAENSKVEPSVSNTASVPVGSNGDTFVEVARFMDSQPETYISISPASTEDFEQPSSGNNEPLSPQNIESYADIDLVKSQSPAYKSQQAQRIQDTPAYDSESSIATPFFQSTAENDFREHGLASPSKIPRSAAGSSNLLSTVAMTHQQQQPSQQQQQAMSQLYPQVHIPHYHNFMPYRHVFSPVFVPPMAMPNYTSNPAYPHPSNGNSYLVLPGASSHLPAGGIRYASSQYKPLSVGSPTAYGSFSSPAAFAIGTPSIRAAMGLEEIIGFKYKDNNLYVPNQQVENSDMWIQTPRELQGLQSTPYYNLAGHAAHATAFMSAHAAVSPSHTPFNTVAAAAVQPSPMQYPGMYHPPQQASIAGPHRLVRQQASPNLGLATAGGPPPGWSIPTVPAWPAQLNNQLLTQ